MDNQKTGFINEYTYTRPDSSELDTNCFEFLAKQIRCFYKKKSVFDAMDSSEEEAAPVAKDSGQTVSNQSTQNKPKKSVFDLMDSDSD